MNRVDLKFASYEAEKIEVVNLHFALCRPSRGREGVKMSALGTRTPLPRFAHLSFPFPALSDNCNAG